MRIAHLRRSGLCSGAAAAVRRRCQSLVGRDREPSRGATPCARRPPRRRLQEQSSRGPATREARAPQTACLRPPLAQDCTRCAVRCARRPLPPPLSGLRSGRPARVTVARARRAWFACPWRPGAVCGLALAGSLGLGGGRAGRPAWVGRRRGIFWAYSQMGFWVSMGLREEEFQLGFSLLLDQICVCFFFFLCIYIRYTIYIKFSCKNNGYSTEYP